MFFGIDSKHRGTKSIVEKCEDAHVRHRAYEDNEEKRNRRKYKQFDENREIIEKLMSGFRFHKTPPGRNPP